MAPTPLQAWFVGEGSLLVRCAEVFRARGHVVAGVASSDPAVKRWAESEQLPLAAVDADLPARLAAAPFDYLFSVVNLAKFEPAVIAAPRRGAINFHDGPLPAYAGLNAPVWALLHGERRYGVTWHEMTAEVDAGRILKQQLFDVADDETSFGLNARCYEAGLQAFTALVDDLTSGRITPVEQSAGARTVFRRLQRPAGHLVIDWSQPAGTIARAVRAVDFGPYPNPFGSVRLLTAAGAFVVAGVSIETDEPSPGPGVIAAIDDRRILVGTADGRLAIESIRRPTGEPISPAELAAEAGLRPGAPIGGAATPHDEDALQGAVREEARWLEALADLDLVDLPRTGEAAPAEPARVRHTGHVPDGLAGEQARRRVTASTALFLARLAGRPRASVPLAVAAPPAAGLPLLADRVPVPLVLDRPWREALTAVERTADAAVRGSFFVDVCLRHPDRPSVAHFARWRTHVVLDPDGHVPRDTPEPQLIVRVASDGRSVEWEAAADVLTQAALSAIHDQWAAFVEQALASPDTPVAALPLIDDSTRQRLVEAWNATDTPYPRACIHELIERQVAITPEATAIVCRDASLSYRDLDARANRLARHLQSLGIGPEDRVGICLGRTIALPVALLGVLKAGAAYVPLDPHYPRERLALVAGDAGLGAVIVEPALADRFPDCPHVVCLERDRASIEAFDGTSPGITARPDNLAYVIYTSGSTGTPKGVMIEHRQAVNFFVGMDACVPHEAPGAWLSVTSISFDISVLELFWTLARGFTVVLYPGEAGTSLPATVSARPEPIDLSLFYFSADENQDAGSKYRLLIEGAKFADAHGFSAVWTPERHFHAFGGLYPNPAVTGAAVAAITTRVGIRAGSCVLPLHHPLRIAEEWSVVDNISGGRVGIAFASGWQPNDFVLRPESYATRRQALFDGLRTVQALWRGETIDVTTPRGDVQALRTLPRPVQAELPTWITAAGNPETFAAAAAAGAGVLTHLLGQTIDELAAKIAAYHEAWRAAGREGLGHVVLMLHTLVGDEEARVRELVREPLMAYLRTSIDLVRPFAESFPTFAARSGNPSEIFASLSPEDYEALVAHSFERYFETSGLFGRPETCLQTIDRLKAIGVDEVACLIDFGVPTDAVLENLPHLHALLERANGRPPARDDSIAGLIARHGITHLQCTPSMARMLLIDPVARRALGRLRAMFVGGEALPPALAADLCDALGEGELWNMYGPTETTVWSTVARVAPPVESVTIGRPIANTRIYILDAARQPVPVGMAGDLYIGGEGVARGYWRRPELTSERFGPDPFRTDGSRIYATGDLARYRDDGTIEFLGRSDQQVKVRGHRIELGEIESAIGALPGVREAVVVAREDREGDRRLVAYVIAAAGAPQDGQAVRATLAERLPDVLVPSHVVFLQRFPLTPNNKIDRKALPAPEERRTAARAMTPASTGMEQTIVDVWREVLGTEAVGAEDNFFDIGGDSLLAAQVLGLLRSRLPRPVSLTDLFRFPTVRALAAHLGGELTDRGVTASTDRARARQNALQQRRAARARPEQTKDTRP